MLPSSSPFCDFPITLQAARVRERRASETPQQTSDRHQRDRERHQPLHGLPTLDQRAVQDKMRRFHTHLTTLDMPTCSTCCERFPGIRLASGSTECARCHKDQHVPKVFSAANQMDPGPIPSQLQVKEHIHAIVILI